MDKQGSLWKKIILGFLGIALLGAWVLTVWNSKAKERAEKAFQNLAKAAKENDFPFGEPLTSPKINEEKNGKNSFLKLFALQDKHVHEVDDIEEFYDEILDEINKKGSFPKEKLDELIIELKKISPLLEALKEALSYERTVFPLKYEDGNMMLLEHLTNLKSCTRLSMMKAFTLAHEEKYKESLQLLIQSFKIAKPLEEDRVLISGLVELAILGNICDSLSCILSYTPYQKELEDELLVMLNQYNAKEKFFNNLIFEVAVISRAFRSIQEGNTGEFLEQELGDSSSLASLPFLKWYFYQDCAFFYQCYTLLIEQKNKSNYELDRAILDIEKSLSELSPLQCPMTRTLMPSMLTIWERYKMGKARLDTIQIYLYARKYQEEHGYFPATLEELKVKFPQTPTKDLMRNDNYIYKLNRDSLLIYSVGINKLNDGGKFKDESDCGFKFLLLR